MVDHHFHVVWATWATVADTDRTSKEVSIL